MELTIGNILALGAALGGLITGVFAIRKVTAESESVVVTTAEKVVMMVRRELEAVHKLRKTDLAKYEADRQAWAKERETMRILIEEHERRIERLELFLVGIGHDPKTINGPT